VTYFTDKNLQNMRRIGIVNRWQLAPVLRRESVLEHSVTVLMIYGWLCARYDVAANIDSVMTALLHDSDEAITGDAPSTNNKTSAMKRAERCMNFEYALLKAADYLESIVYLNEERASGNQRLEDCLISTVDDYYYPWMERANALITGEADAHHAVARKILTDMLHIYSPSRHPSMEN
jgi:5'-deoxynucleotidase YfbR-like HD superfamily hydrolase